METLYLIQAAEKSYQKRDQPWWKEKEQPKRPPARDRRESGKSQQPGMVHIIYIYMYIYIYVYMYI